MSVTYNLGRGPAHRSLLTLVLLLAATLCAAAADLVTDVRAVAAKGNLTQAAGLVAAYEKQRGQTAESILARSWVARTALVLKQYDLADQVAEQVYAQVQKELAKRTLDREPALPLALGASLEVQANVLAAKGQRTEAVAMLESELKKYANSSIHARVQKNINLLSLAGKPAPALSGVTLPKGKPALLFFWAHWCPDCRAEAPLLAQLKKEYGPRGLVVIGPTQRYGYIGSQTNVPVPVEMAHIEAIRREFYSAVLDGPTIVNEQNFLAYGVSTTPTLTLVDRQGIVRLYHPGAMQYAELKSAVESLLAVR
jgi:thiol-disulfide isomerase/thioredoxin